MATLDQPQIDLIVERLQAGESGNSIALSLGISPQRVSEVRKFAGIPAPIPVPPKPKVKEPDAASPASAGALREEPLTDSDAAALRKELKRLLPVKKRARLMVDLVQDPDVAPSTRAKLLERIDSLCGIHEAPPEKEESGSLIGIESLPSDLTF